MGYDNCFDIAYAEGGILHYFHDINRFFYVLYGILKSGGELILSDFHPFRKVLRTGPTASTKGDITQGDYFETLVHEDDVAYKGFFTEKEQKDFPSCSLRFYTLSEVINAVIGAGFTLKEFNEHPHWEDKKLPGEFTIVAEKQEK